MIDHNDQEQFLLTTDRDDADHATDRERSCVPHENPGGMTVEPEKAKTGTDQCRTDDGQLSRKRIKRNL